MKIIEPSYEIMRSIPENGIWVLKELEEAARVCYKSEDKATDDGESARKLVDHLLKNDHEVPIEFYDITVKFVCDRGVSHEMVRHRLASFCQESTRYCNYSKGKFGGEIMVIEPVIFSEMDAGVKAYLRRQIAFRKLEVNDVKLEPMQRLYTEWIGGVLDAEAAYMYMLQDGATPEIARSVLPTCLKTEVMMKANLREWRHILKLRTSEKAHPEMRRLMLPLLCELHSKIPIVFDDIWWGACAKGMEAVNA